MTLFFALCVFLRYTSFLVQNNVGTILALMVFCVRGNSSVVPVISRAHSLPVISQQNRHHGWPPIWLTYTIANSENSNSALELWCAVQAADAQLWSLQQECKEHDEGP
ncbi:hypothetical protein [Bifidobacterium aquikefiricola]|uniref:Secreted protein n=1 Tax=Bifidobacterium aquikefiricola TaxID=3059038 RepID=A0AB39U4Q4_9BIFI